MLFKAANAPDLVLNLMTPPYANADKMLWITPFAFHTTQAKCCQYLTIILLILVLVPILLKYYWYT